MDVVHESTQYGPAEKLAIIEKEKQKLFYEMEKQYIDKRLERFEERLVRLEAEQKTQSSK